MIYYRNTRKITVHKDDGCQKFLNKKICKKSNKNIIYLAINLLMFRETIKL